MLLRAAVSPLAQGVRNFATKHYVRSHSAALQRGHPQSSPTAKTYEPCRVSGCIMSRGRLSGLSKPLRACVACSKRAVFVKTPGRARGAPLQLHIASGSCLIRGAIILGSDGRCIVGNEAHYPGTPCFVVDLDT